MMKEMKVAIIGAGSMGRGICQLFATAGHHVKLIDISAEVLNSAHDFILKMLSRQVEKGKMTSERKQEIFDRIKVSQALEDCKHADLVIEAIVEKLDVKKGLFVKLEGIVAKGCILASNTSSLSVSAIASACSKPDRVIGMHFFNPAPLMKLVEVIPALQSRKELPVQVLEIVAQLGKEGVLVKDTPGFIVNRIARPFYGEALRILDEGLADEATIDWAMKEIGGFRMGPFQLMDYIGNDINYTVTETVFKAFYYDDRFKPSYTQKRLSDAGYYGRKSGRGYYDYRKGAANPEPDKDPNLGRAIFERILCMLINEAADALFWRIASAEDIETAMTKGVNYPRGLLQWADEFGIDNCVNLMDQLFNIYRESRYRCSPMLRAKQAANSLFFT